jgi:hypothetical protein
MEGIRLPNSAGLVTTTGGGVHDLVHTLGTMRANVRRSAVVRRILAYNNTGANVTLQFGTQSLAAVFVQYMPDLVALNGLDNEWNEWDIPLIHYHAFNSVPYVAATSMAGDIYVLASAANVLLVIEVEEFGA